MIPDTYHSIPNGVLLDHITTLLEKGKRVKFRAKGDSMQPFIQGEGDAVELSPVGELKRNDIVLARIADGVYLLHRIIRIEGDEMLLAGDSNLYQTENCHRSDIFGLAVSVVRNGKRYSLISRRSRLEARIWRGLLPVRRIINIIKQLIIR